MTITFTLQSQYTGATYVAGPFNISGTTSGNVTYELATGVTKSELAAGHVVNTEYETITGGTIQSTGTCTNSEPWSVTPTPTPTPTSLNGSCFTYTYDQLTPPTGVSARWRNILTGEVDTTLITNLEAMDNGDGTTTVYLCVQQGSSYATPACVIGGIEQSCPDAWVSTGCDCSQNSTCLLGC
jgi:hypothetical protein